MNKVIAAISTKITRNIQKIGTNFRVIKYEGDPHPLIAIRLDYKGWNDLQDELPTRLKKIPFGDNRRLVMTYYDLK